VVTDPSQQKSVAVAKSVPILHGKSPPRWRQIASSIQKEITGGIFGVGSQLPTEAEFSSRFAVSRHTIRRALIELKAQGLIRIEQGRGSFVTESVLDYSIGSRVRFSDTIRQQNRELQRRVLRVEEVLAEAHIADQLKIRRGRLTVLMERLSVVDGRPVAIGRHWFSAARFPGIAILLAEELSITKVLAKLGVSAYRRSATRVTARMPTSEEAALLEQPRTLPILVTQALNVDPKDEPVEVSIGCFASGRVRIVAGR
jgi:GntR family phosphonate transport system transcriptional regulator